MTAVFNPLALQHIGMWVVAAIASQQNHILPRLGMPQQARAEPVGNFGALAGKQSEPVRAVFADYAVVTSRVLAFCFFARLRVFNLFWQSK